MFTSSTKETVAAGAARRGQLILHYHTTKGGFRVACDKFPLRDDWLDVPFEVWKQWSYVQLVVRPGPSAPQAELVLSDLRGRFLRNAAGHPQPVICTGSLSERLDFASCGRGLSLQLAIRVGRADKLVKIIMGLTAHGSLPDLGPHLRPPSARLSRSQ